MSTPVSLAALLERFFTQSARLVLTPGLAGVITPSSCWQCRQVCAYPR